MKKVLAVVFALVLVISLAACGKTDTPPVTDTPADGSSTEVPATTGDGPQYGGVAKLVCTAEGANPIGVPWESFGVDTTLLIPAGETLVIQKTNGESVPFLAESFEADTENLEIRFKLHEGIMFHDGTELTAEVAVWNLERTIEQGGNVSTEITGVEVRGEYEFAILLNTFQFSVLAELASRANCMISKESFEKNGIEWARDNIVGTGPFKMKEYVQGSHLTFEKNENYWQEGKPYLDGMEYQFIRDVMTQNVALQGTGDQGINMLNTTNGEQIQMFTEMGYTASKMPIGPISLVPNSLDSSSPLANADVRRAISYALDRDSIVAARGFGVLEPATQFVAEAWAAHLPDSYNLSYDVDKAKELMASAGYADGFSTTLYAQPGLADKDAVVAMQAQLAVIGIDAAVEFPDSGGYSAYRSNGWEGLLVQHTRNLPYIASSFNFYFGNNVRLLSQLWWPDEMEGYIQSAFTKQDNTSDVQDAHKLVLDEQIVIPVYYLYDSWVGQPNINGGGFGEWGSSTQYQPEEIWMSN